MHPPPRDVTVEPVPNAATDASRIEATDGSTIEAVDEKTGADEDRSGVGGADDGRSGGREGDAYPLRRRLGISAVLAAPVLALSVVPTFQFTHWQWIALTLAAPVAVWGAWPFHVAAWAGLRAGAVSPDTLVSAGTLGALGWSLYALVGGAAGAPGFTQAFTVPAATTAAGGSIHLDGAASVVVLVLAARYLERRATSGAAQPGSGAPAEPTQECPADRVERALVPSVVALAVVALGYWLGARPDGATAVPAALAVLLVAAPGALGLVTPLALLAGTRRAAHLGVRATGAQVLLFRRVDRVVLEQAGTVTTGVLAVRAVHPAATVSADTALRLAGAVEQAAEHPTGRAVADAARAGGDLPGVAEFDGHAGLGDRGLVAEVDGDPSHADGHVVAHAVLVGRSAFLAGFDITLPPELTAARVAAEAAGCAAVAVAWDGVARAVVVVGDEVRSDGVEAVRRLRGLGLGCLLLSGEDAPTAHGVAAQIGLAGDAVLADVRPDGEADAVRPLQDAGHVVAVIGRRAGGAAASTRADVGLVVGAADLAGRHPTDRCSRGAGTRAGGGIVPVQGGLLAAVDAIELFRRTLVVIRTNRLWLLAYHLVALPAAAAGLVNPLAAGAAAAAASSLVVLTTDRRLRSIGGIAASGTAREPGGLP